MAQLCAAPVQKEIESTGKPPSSSISPCRLLMRLSCRPGGSWENPGRRRSGMPVRFPGDHSGLPGRRAEGKRGGGQCKQPSPVDGGTDRSALGYRASEHRRLPVHSKGEMEAGDVSGIRWLVLP